MSSTDYTIFDKNDKKLEDTKGTSTCTADNTPKLQPTISLDKSE